MTVLNLFSDPAATIVFILAVALAIGVHEAAHAYTADKLGDNTAKLLGRTNINPLVHLDAVGTICFLLFGFGWGKPVPVNESRLRQRYDVILVSLAGPFSNLIVAALLGLIIRLLPQLGNITLVLEIFVYINLSLMLFNLIPIPPLDGSKLLRLVLPDRITYMLEQYGFILILMIFLLFQSGGGLFVSKLTALVELIFHFLTGTYLT